MTHKDENKFDRRENKPYSRDEKLPNRHWHKPSANATGKLINYDKNNKNEISFIADSGATEHIVNKGLILSNFEKFKNKSIKSANKNEKADIHIDGKGKLFLKTNVDSENLIELTNVIAAKDIACNLMSLRKFVDIGLSIYLDNKYLKIFDKETGQEYLSGNYEKPHWVITLTTVSKDISHSEKYYDNYLCNAQIVSLDEFLQQSQTNDQEIPVKTSEGEFTPDSDTDYSTEIGREKNSELEIDSEKSEPGINKYTINRKILDLNGLNFKDIPENLLINEINKTVTISKKISEALLWHQRLGHASVKYLKELQKTNIELQKIRFDDCIKNCEICILAKSERKPFKESRTKAETPLGKIHMDIMGPIKPLSFPEKNKFIIVFLDDYSRYARIFSIKTKDQAGECLEKFLQNARNILGKNQKVCYIRADNAKEFTGGDFKSIMDKEKIDEDFAPTYTPELNGTAERFNKSLAWKIRSLLIDSGLPPSMWILAAETAVHIYNRTPHKTIKFATPLSLFAPNQKHHLEKLKRFGCIAYVNIPNPDTKFSDRAIKTIHVGYTKNAYVLWHPPTGRFLTSRNVDFNEHLTYKDGYKNKEKENITIQNDSENRKNSEKETDTEQETQKVESKTKSTKKRKSEQKLIEPETKVRKPPMRKAKEGRDFTIYAKKANTTNLVDTSFAFFTAINLNLDNVILRDFFEEGYFSDDLEEDELIFTLLAGINKDPTSIREALSSKESIKWKNAIEEELKAMYENEVWVLVDRPESEAEEKKLNIIDSKWVLKRKTGENNEIKHKARLVIRGFKDKKVYELKETYAPVSRLALVRTILAIVNKYDFELCQMDVKTAFLNGVLETEMYMEIPEGVEVDKETRKKKICKILKALYGLKISPKRWNARLNQKIRKLDLENDLHEPCLYTWRKLGKIVFVLVYVDDLLIGGNCLEKMNEVIKSLEKEFKMKNLGEPKIFLGMNIKRDRKNQIIQIDQSDYTENILERFNMKTCKPQNSPMESRQVQNRKHKNNSDFPSQIYTPKVPYREAIGSLLYLAGATRPDIAFSVNMLARRQVDPTADDWESVKRIFRYLRGTTNLGLTYRAKSDNLEAASDASFRDWNDSTSSSGYVISLYGDTIAWRSHKQSHVTTSTCEAEYLAMSDTCKELISLDKAIRNVTGKTYYPIKLWCDNMAAGKNTEMEGCHKLKNFDDKVEKIKENLRFREQNGTKVPMGVTHGDYVKLLVLEGKIKTGWINTKENIADIMTKPLEWRSHHKLTKKIHNSD